MKLLNDVIQAVQALLEVILGNELIANRMLSLVYGLSFLAIAVAVMIYVAKK